MQVRTRHTPTFGVARLVLAPGELVLVDPLTVAATSYGLAVEVKGAGAKAVALCTAGAEGGWLDAAPALPGDLHLVELDGTHGWCLARLSWIASSSSWSWNGLGRNSMAPALIARTDIGMSPWPVMKTTGSSTPVWASSR